MAKVTGSIRSDVFGEVGIVADTVTDFTTTVDILRVAEKRAVANALSAEAAEVNAGEKTNG